MNKKERIINDTLKAHNKTIFRKIDVSKALFLFIGASYIFAIHPTYIEIYIDSDLTTKKNNYTIMFTQGEVRNLLSKYKKMNAKTLLGAIKHMVFIGKPDKVKKDEQKIKNIFKDISQWNFEYFQRHNNLKILFTSNFNKNHTANIMLAYNKINLKEKVLSTTELQKTFEPLVKRYFEFFFANPFFCEEYHYITELYSVGEKDTSNTPELFNDVFEIGATILGHKFNDKQIIDIHGRKVYYKKENTVFTPFYIFKIEPKTFILKEQKKDKEIKEKAELTEKTIKKENTNNSSDNIEQNIDDVGIKKIESPSYKIQDKEEIQNVNEQLNINTNIVEKNGGINIIETNKNKKRIILNIKDNIFGLFKNEKNNIINNQNIENNQKNFNNEGNIFKDNNDLRNISNNKYYPPNKDLDVDEDIFFGDFN